MGVASILEMDVTSESDVGRCPGRAWGWPGSPSQSAGPLGSGAPEVLTHTQILRVCCQAHLEATYLAERSDSLGGPDVLLVLQVRPG